MWPFNHPNMQVTDTGLRIIDKPEDRPKFAREYSAQLDHGRSIKITMRSAYTGNERYSSGELDQTGGRWVMFDPDKVADKILDPALVPLVEERCREIKRLDADFMRTHPSEFLDEAGHRWQRVA